MTAPFPQQDFSFSNMEANTRNSLIYSVTLHQIAAHWPPDRRNATSQYLGSASNQEQSMMGNHLQSFTFKWNNRYMKRRKLLEGKEVLLQTKGPPPLSFPQSRKWMLRLPPCIIHGRAACLWPERVPWPIYSAARESISREEQRVPRLDGDKQLHSHVQRQQSAAHKSGGL